MSKREDSRASQIRRLFTAAGITGLTSKHSQIYGIRGWRIFVTNQTGEAANGETLNTRVIRLNREMPTAIVRTKVSGGSSLTPQLSEAVTYVTVERLVELLAFWHEHHREEKP